jgi:hypothetical protein
MEIKGSDTESFEFPSFTTVSLSTAGFAQPVHDFSPDLQTFSLSISDFKSTELIPSFNDFDIVSSSSSSKDRNAFILRYNEFAIFSLNPPKDEIKGFDHIHVREVKSKNKIKSNFT